MRRILTLGIALLATLVAGRLGAPTSPGGSTRPSIGLIRSIARPPQTNGRLRSLNEMEAEMLSKGPRGAANRLLSRKEAAAFLTELGLRRSAQTLARLFCERKGPKCMRVGNRAMYRECDLVEYFHQQCSAPRQSSSDPLQPASRHQLPLSAGDCGTRSA